MVVKPHAAVPAVLLLVACASTEGDPPQRVVSTAPPQEIACEVDEAPEGEAATIVTVHFIVSELGHVVPGSPRISAIRGSDRRVGAMALEAVMHCTFEPALQHGQPVPARHQRAFRFRAVAAGVGAASIRAPAAGPTVPGAPPPRTRG